MSSGKSLLLIVIMSCFISAGFAQDADRSHFRRIWREHAIPSRSGAI